jgi:hypothetical protein
MFAERNDGRLLPIVPQTDFILVVHWIEQPIESAVLQRSLHSGNSVYSEEALTACKAKGQQQILTL